MPYKKEDALVFVHIPKTAGSTFHMILNSRYPHSSVKNLFGSRYKDKKIAAFINAPESQKKHIRLLKGHMPFGLHEYLPHSNCRYISVLRDPVERVISQYFYIKKNAHNPFHEKVHKGGMSIGEFVSSGIMIGVNNGQCRFLNGDMDEYEFDASGDELLQSVKTHIENHFCWLGITERFDESVLLLSKLMEWSSAPYYIRENVSKIRRAATEVDEADITVIKRFNQLDIALYQYANEFMDDQISRFSGFEQDISVFKQKNTRIQRRWAWLPDRLKRFVI